MHGMSHVPRWRSMCRKCVPRCQALARHCKSLKPVCEAFCTDISAESTVRASSAEQFGSVNWPNTCVPRPYIACCNRFRLARAGSIGL